MLSLFILVEDESLHTYEHLERLDKKASQDISLCPDDYQEYLLTIMETVEFLFFTSNSYQNTLAVSSNYTPVYME